MASNVLLTSKAPRLARAITSTWILQVSLRRGDRGSASEVQFAEEFLEGRSSTRARDVDFDALGPDHERQLDTPG